MKNTFPETESGLAPGERMAMAGATVATGGLAVTFLIGHWWALPGFSPHASLGVMAPGAAWALLALGVAFVLVQWRAGWGAGKRLALGLVGAVAVADTALGLRNLVAHWSVWDPERRLASDAAIAAGFAVQRLSPMTAAALLLSAFVLGALVLEPVRSLRQRRALLAISLGLVFLCGFSALSRLAGVSLFAVGTVSISFWTALGLTLLNLALALAAGLGPELHRTLLGEESAGVDGLPVSEQRKRHLLLAGLAGFCALLAGGAFAFIRTLVERERANITAQLTNVAELKSDQIEAWRRERMADARTLMRVPFLADNLSRLAGDRSDAAVRAPLAAYLDEFRRAYGYEAVVLLDRALAPVLAAPANAAQRVRPSPGLQQGIAHATDVLVEDLYAGPNGGIGMDFLVPIRAPDGANRAGAVLLHVDARRQLFPLIARWPALSRSAEALMVRREGDALVILNDLRFHSDAALKLRLPLDQPGLLAAIVTREVPSELRDGRDYRNVPGLGLARLVADSPWRVIVKIDKTEAYAPVRADAWRVGLGVGVFLTMGGLLIGSFWRKRQRDYERWRWEAGKERQISEMKSRFITVTSHEFRTPITVAMGTVELLRNHLDRLAPAKRIAMFDRIANALHHMTGMLDDLQLLNRIESGRTQVKIAPVDLQRCVQGIVEEARLIDRDAHRFEYRGEGDASAVATDEQLLHPILSNLLSNAVRYSPPASVVTVVLQVDSSRVYLAVEDQGIGVPEVDRARIFEAFERGSNVGTSKGTGLGLNIVRRLTEMLGGICRVEAPAGQGSRFVLEFPRSACTPAG